MPRPRTGGRQRVNRNCTIGWGSSGRMFQSGATYWLERLGTDHMWARPEPLYGIGDCGCLSQCASMVRLHGVPMPRLCG